jgi:general L-amino acid transport system permease protein
MTQKIETLRPAQYAGTLDWIRQNLFNNAWSSLLTILSSALIVWLLSVTLRWVFVTADWEVVLNFPVLYLAGQYPREQLWRIGASLLLFSFLSGASWRVWGGVFVPFTVAYALLLAAGMLWPVQAAGITLATRILMFANLALIGLAYMAAGSRFFTPLRLLIAWIVILLLGLVLLNGIPGLPWLPVVSTGLWGGLLVTMILAIGSIIISFPIGVLLALGRRSSLPVVSVLSTVFIEVIRGMPLIGILFLSSLILPLFLPPQMQIDRLLRALAGLTIFSAAYMAENVRGGLAAVASGQAEAARALGFSPIQTTFLIVLPQALRAVIPPIVGHFISLFKDTTLASGIAVIEFLAIGRSIVGADPAYIDQQMEMLIFVAAVFWIYCYLMSYASLRLERSLGVGER